MPMRNGEPYVRAAVQSVLDQQGVNLELVVVDDGSTDSSRTTVTAFADSRVRIVDGPCQGFARSLNTGLAAAQGTYLMQCDADDLLPPGRIARQLQWLTEHPEFEAIAGGFSTIEPNGQIVAEPIATPSDWMEITEELTNGVVRTSLCTYLMHRNVITRVGVLRPFFETSPDIDFQLRLGELCRVAYRSNNTYFYRLHNTSITHTQVNARREFFENCAHQFQRQRLSLGSDALADGSPPEPPSAPGPCGNLTEQIQGQLVGQAWRYFRQGDKSSALHSAWRGLKLRPTTLGAWRALLLIAVRRTGAK